MRPQRRLFAGFDAVDGERRDKVRFIKINTEAAPPLSSRFGIRSIPTIMLFKQGEKVDSLRQGFCLKGSTA